MSVAMARISRPPGFDMTYRPSRASFGPPLDVRLPSIAYFGIASTVLLGIVIAPYLPTSTWVYQFVVVGDRTRMMPSIVFAIVLFTSALASILRQQMSGVVVHPDGVEIREVISFGLPRLRKYAWAQIDKLAIPTAPEARVKQRVDEAPRKLTKVRLDLWDGRHEWLPPVAKGTELFLTLERVALARAIPIEGGSGMLDDLESPFGDD
jgi:hypothetical protein